MHIMSYIQNKQKFYIKDTSESQDTFIVGVHGHHTIPIFKKCNKYTTFSNYLLIVDDYYNVSKLYGKKNITI